MLTHSGNNLQSASLVLVGNLPDKTYFTFANSVRGAKIKYGDRCEINRVTVLETEGSMATPDERTPDERSRVIHSILGQKCSITYTPCIDDFRMRAFQTIAEELRRKDVSLVIVDITNGQRTQTFDLIVATSICRIENVIITSVSRDAQAVPYSDLDDSAYTVTAIRPFSQERSLEAAAQFELIYYADRIRESVERLRGLPGTELGGFADRVESTLANVVINYFSDDPENLDNALKRLSELHEGVAKRLVREVSGLSGDRDFSKIVERIREDISQPARKAAEVDDHVDEDLLAVAMLDDLLDYLRKFRNYMAHPYRRKIGVSRARLMIFATFTLLEEFAAAISWLAKTGDNHVHLN